LNIKPTLLIFAFVAALQTNTCGPERLTYNSGATAVAPSATASPTPSPAGKPDILSRQAWGASPPTGEMKRHTPVRITIHHTASPQNARLSLSRKMQSLQKTSQSPRLLAGREEPLPAWPDVPYHFYIVADGQIAEGREVNYVGDTNTNYDPAGHLLIVLEGNFENEEPSDAQLKSLYALTLWAAEHWRVFEDDIKGHKDYASTLCPGRNLQNILPHLREHVRSHVQKPSATVGAQPSPA
jgi:hypothetical protein